MDFGHRRRLLRATRCRAFHNIVCLSNGDSTPYAPIKNRHGFPSRQLVRSSSAFWVVTPTAQTGDFRFSRGWVTLVLLLLYAAAFLLWLSIFVHSLTSFQPRKHPPNISIAFYLVTCLCALQVWRFQSPCSFYLFPQASIDSPVNVAVFYHISLSMSNRRQFFIPLLPGCGPLQPPAPFGETPASPQQ